MCGRYSQASDMEKIVARFHVEPPGDGFPRRYRKRPKCITNFSQTVPETYERKASGVAGISRDIGAAIGSERIGVDVTEILPGKQSSYLHHHQSKEEFFYVLSGRCSIRIGEKIYELEAGDAVSRPAGTGIPHQFSNPFKEPCSVLMMGAMTGKGVEDIIEWPELKRRMVIDAAGNHRIEKIKRNQTRDP